MLQKLIERRQHGREEGFTLIELMVVVLIIAILIAIAIPTFLGARGRAQNRSAQSNLRNALTAAKTIFTDQDKYVDSTTQLNGVEPSLTWTNAAPSKSVKNQVAVKAVSDTEIVLGAQADTGKCYYIKDLSNGPGGVSYGSVDPGANACPAPADSPTGVTFNSDQATGWNA